jgi:NAD-dependent SIR2 family protein deacetylase
MPTPPPNPISLAALSLRLADAVVVSAGAGISVDSGIPDYRSSGGFWRDYKPLQKLGVTDPKALGNAKLFATDPLLFLGIQAHMRALYEKTSPHAGYAALRGLIGLRPYSVFTSNVDSAFVQSGFEPWRVAECHGNITRAQCGTPCSDHTWDMPHIAHDPDTLRALEPLPRCPSCGGLARPNVCLFDDSTWIGAPYISSQLRHFDWLRSAAERGERVVIVECGAGSELPVVRMHSHGVMRKNNATLIRINITESEGPDGTISIPLGARDALLAIAAASADIV